MGRSRSQGRLWNRQGRSAEVGRGPRAEGTFCANPQVAGAGQSQVPGGEPLEQPEVRQRLSELVRSLTTDADLWEDLLQEAAIHLWRMALEHPGQTASWYLQSCRFHLLDLLKSGRSVHAPRHHNCLCDISGQSDATESEEDWLKAGEDLFGSVSARDILHELLLLLEPSDQSILRELTDGQGVRETARRLGVAYHAVREARRRIAGVARQLGIQP